MTTDALSRSDARFGRRMVAPSAILLLILLGLPTVLTVVYSLHDVPDNGRGLGPFVGWENYEIVFGARAFWRSVSVTLWFSAGFVVLSTVIGLAMALLLNQNFLGRGLARAILIVPWVTPWLVIGILWKWFLDGSVGGLNAVLMHAGLIDDYIEFLADPDLALPMVVIAAVWRQASFSGLLFLAGLQTLPGELKEAASIDGASAGQRLRHIVLPWLRPVVITVLVLNIIYAFLQFDVVFAMTQGGPGDATQVLGVLIYRQMFGAPNIGVGATLAVILALASLVGGLVTVALLYRKEEH